MDNVELIQQARELCEKATPGPWMVKVKGNTVESHQVMSPGNGPVCSAISPKTKNAQFISASRTLVPQLCDALEEAQKEIERLNVALTLSKARENPQELFPELTTQQRAENAEIVALTTRAEKAEAERDTYKAALQNWHEPPEGE